MHLQKTLTKIAAYIVIASIAITSLALSVPMYAYAQDTATDDNGNNILKVLDMALNKAGISASPTTIQDFLDYMFGTVTDAGQVLSDTFSGAYDTVSDFVVACKNKVSDTASNIPAPAKSLINGYLDYMGNCFDVVENAKAGYAQGKNFRNYLMSYVTDMQDKRINGVISNNNKYNIKGELVNLVRQNMDAYIEEHEGYYIVPTLTYKDMDVFSFSDKNTYDKSVALLKTLPDNFICLFSGGTRQCFAPTDDLVIVGSSSADSSYFSVSFYHNDWTVYIVSGLFLEVIGDGDLSSSFDLGNVFYSSAYLYTSYIFKSSSFSSTSIVLFTTDGRTVKVWKSLDAFKASSVGQSNIYYSKDYSSFDDTKDNGVTFTGNYYNGSYSHDTIQNNIDNSQTIDDSTVNNIVNNYVTNNYYGTDDSSGSGSGSGSGSWWDIGTGVNSFIQGVASLLDFILDLLGKLIGLLGDFLTSTLQLLSSLSALGQGFGEFISSAFSFLPEECITLIVSSIGVMCFVGVVKLIKG